jgi:N-6 DNA Methylase
MRPVREITLLDPACGTMHFGLVAFDLFAAMYREEIEHAGEPDWPATPSVANPDDIPAAIIEHNLYGIDIDLRAVQLSALTLLLKARSLNSKATISDHNLACTDVLLLNGERLNAFLEEFRLTRPIYQRLIRGLWSRLKDANQLGSLLRLETDLAEIIAEEQRKYEAPMLPGFSSEQFETEAGLQEFWTIIEGQILQAFDEFARQRAAEGKDERYFTGEATKGLRVLNMLLRRYDIVVTNPPYIDSRDYNPRLKSLIDAAYPASKRNTYAAFTERCLELLSDGGRLGIITGQSFMFISSFEKFRQQCLQKHAIEYLAQFDYGLFAEVRMDTAAYVLRREPNTLSRTNAIGTYFRLVKEADARAKQQRFEQALTRLSAGWTDPIVCRYRQGDFDAIGGAPWVYWITPSLRRLFITLPKLGEIAQPRQGLATTDNFRFLRNWWEVGINGIGFGYGSTQQAASSSKRWFPYMKGGSFRRWCGNQEHVVNWEYNGLEIKEQILCLLSLLERQVGVGREEYRLLLSSRRYVD